MSKPEKWSDPLNKLFAHQVGFTAPPMDFDAAPSDFMVKVGKATVTAMSPRLLRGRHRLRRIPTSD